MVETQTLSTMFAVVFIGLCIILKGSQMVLAQTDILSPSSVSVKENNSVTLICTYDHSNVIACGWSLEKRYNYIISKNCTDIGSPQVNTTLYSYQCQGSFTWTIKHATRKNNGDRWKCEIFRVDAYNIQSNVVQINVEVPIQSVTMTYPSGSLVDILENTKQTFECSTNVGKPKSVVWWFKDKGTPADKTDDINITSFSTSSSNLNGDGLFIVTSFLSYNVSRNDNAMTIFCTANNSRTLLSSKRIILNVKYSASVTSFYVQGYVGLSSVEVMENDSVTFICNFDSNPEPSVTLLFQGNTLYSQASTKTLSYVHRKIACRDAGIYTCVVNNQYNKGNHSTMDLALFVKCSPRPEVAVHENITSALHVSVTLSFATIAYPVPSTQSGYIWQKKNSKKWQLLRSSSEVQIFVSGLRTSLFIISVTKENYGQYQLIVTNSVGTYRQFYFLGPEDLQIENEYHEKEDSVSTILGICLGVVSVGVVLLAAYSIHVTLVLKQKSKDKGKQISTEMILASASQNIYVSLDDKASVNTDQSRTINVRGDTLTKEENTLYTALSQDSMTKTSEYAVLEI